MEIPVAEKRSFKCRIFSSNHFYNTDFSAKPVFYSSRVVLRLRACNKDTILEADVVKCEIFFSENVHLFRDAKNRAFWREN